MRIRARALVLVMLGALGCSSRSGEHSRVGTQPTQDISPPMTPAGESFDNPIYKRWAQFPVGSAVVQRTTTENRDSPLKTVTDIRYTLKEKTADHLVVEFVATTKHPDGRVEKNPPQDNRVQRQFTLPVGAKKAPERKSEEGEESLTIAGRVYSAKWYKGKDFTEAGELTSQTWSCEEMPGGLVKSISQVAARRATITVEVTEVHIPK